MLGRCANWTSGGGRRVFQTVGGSVKRIQAGPRMVQKSQDGPGWVEAIATFGWTWVGLEAFQSSRRSMTDFPEKLLRHYSIPQKHISIELGMEAAKDHPSELTHPGPSLLRRSSRRVCDRKMRLWISANKPQRHLLRQEGSKRTQLGLPRRRVGVSRRKQVTTGPCS